MLKPLHRGKIDRALKLLDIPVTMNTPGVFNILFEPLMVTVSRWDEDFNIPAITEYTFTDDSRGVFVRAIRNLYGGDVSKVSAIEIFNHGYSVEVRTDVYDSAREEHLVEIHIGHLVND